MNSMDIKDTTYRNIQRLKEALDEPYSSIIRDAAIKRFHYSFEAFWRMLAKHLKEQYEIICRSPKGCFREAFSAGLINEEEREICMEMTNDRNETTHIYNEKLAEIIFTRIKDYAELMGRVVERMKISKKR
ncbi:nucleotidyltransferase substrate binding protein [bacterium]|nr:nucleotidyltransferase substrate binding protein [FCB group bacterium]MBL7190675.1 nucleotidyltransferase substrate binding protein [bacterium]